MIKRLSIETCYHHGIHDLTHIYRFSNKVIMLRNSSRRFSKNVLTPNNIEKVFEVKAKILRDMKAI